MTDERPTEPPDANDAATTALPSAAGDASSAAEGNGRSEAAAGDNAADNLETRVLSPEQARQFAAFRYRQLFAKAQEQFTAGEFVEANRNLKEIPEDARTADVQRLALLVVARIREVAELRSTVQTALNQGKHRDVRPRLERLLELQPGDEWANTIRHRIDEDDVGSPPAKKSVFESPKDAVATRPVIKTLLELPAGFVTSAKAPEEPAPTKPREPAAMERRPSPAATAGTAAVEIVDDDAEVDEAWAFGELLVKPGPPPLKPHVSQPQPVRVRPTFDDDEDFVGWLEPAPPDSSAGVWIAIAVCGVVVLLALIATIVVLLVEKGK